MRRRTCLLLAWVTFAAARMPGADKPRGIVDLLLPAPVKVSGLVVDSEGKPIQRVRIEFLVARRRAGLEYPVVETDAEGRFSADTAGPAVVLRKGGFESQFLRVSDGQPEIRIAMKPAPAMEEIPVLPKPVHCVSVGERFCLPKIKGVYVGPVVAGIDAFEREFMIRGRPLMMHGTGTSWGGPLPIPEEVWTSIEYRERARTGGGVLVIDASGRTTDGKLWRSVGISGETASYNGADSKSAAIMDRILDGLCLISRKASR